MNKLHLGAKWHFRIGGLVAVIPLMIGFIYLFNVIRGVIFAISLANNVDPAPLNLTGLFIFIPIALVVSLILVEIYARLAYNNWAYEFTADGLKLERGIIWKKYSNIPYNRVQNVDIRRGIIARMLGFSTIDIQTAGAAYGGRGGARSEGHIPAVGVEDAEKIRKFVMDKVSKKTAGGM